MRHILVIPLILFASISLHAQTGAGSFMIGGSAGIQRGKVHGSGIVQTPSTTFSLSPTIGYFPVNNFMVGLTGSEQHTWQDQTGLKNRSNSYNIGPILRYYIPFAGRFAFFPEVAATYGKSLGKVNGTSQGTIINEKFTETNYVYRAGGGLTWFISPNIGIEAILAYRQRNQKSTSGYTSLLYANIAIQFYLPRRD